MENKTSTEEEQQQNIQNQAQEINENQNESDKPVMNEFDLKNELINNENIADENKNTTETINTPNESIYVTVTIGGLTVIMPKEVVHLSSEESNTLNAQLSMQRQALIYRKQQLITQIEHIKSQLELHQEELASVPSIRDNDPNKDDLTYQTSFLEERIDEFKKNIDSRNNELLRINEVIKHWSVLYKSADKLQSDTQYKEYLQRNYSAIKIQNLYRLHFSKLVVDSLKYIKENNAALKIQSTFRGYCSRKLADLLNIDKSENEKRAMEIIIRFLEYAKRKIDGNKLLNSKRKERDVIVADTTNHRRIERRQFRAVCLIQRVYRGHLGRIKAGEKRRQRYLHGPIKQHANKYLEKGQLWNFLSCLQADYDDIQRELYEERRFATTYVNEVNKVREENKVKVIQQWRELKKESLKKKLSNDKSSPYLMQLTYSNVRPSELKPVKTNIMKSKRTMNINSKSKSSIITSPIKKNKRKTYVSISKTNLDHTILMMPTTQVQTPIKKKQNNNNNNSNSDWNLNDKHDPVHVLIYQAVLREYIPPFSKSYTAEDAYKEYCQLLPGFQKRQWEDKAKVVATPYIKQLYYDGVRDVEQVYYSQLEKYKIPFFLLKRIKSLAKRVMVASEYVEKNVVSNKYNNGSNLPNTKYSRDYETGILPPVAESPSNSTDDYDLIVKLDDKKDSRVPATKPFGYPISQSEPVLRIVKNDNLAKEKSNEWRKRNINNSLVPLYDEDIEILNVTIDKMNEMKELAAVKRQLLDDIKIPSGDSSIDVLCMYAALEVYLDDYDNFLKTLCSFSQNEIIEMKQYIKAHICLIEKNVKTIMYIMHKNGCDKVKDIIKFPLNKYFDKEFCESIQQIINYKLDHSYSLRKSLQSYNAKYKLGPADPLHKTPHLPPLRHKEGDIKNKNKDILLESI